ncbi:MAG: primase C-terminal domain-containing protein [Deltaproteobacteria bacterium]|nr:primase C-terminal domain-containing protein [Deltaproteobacteria bacterium]
MASPSNPAVDFHALTPDEPLLPAPAAFRFVEFAARRRPGFRNCVVPLAEVSEWVRRYRGFGCYATFYLFDEGLGRYAHGNRPRGVPSVAGYSGPVVAPVWPLDVDAAELGDALAVARRLYRHLTGEWGVPPAAVRAYFSGKKGFHLLVDTRVFRRPTPSKVMPELLHRLTVRLAQELALPRPGPLDLALRDRVRLLRLPNTVHEASRRFKIALSAEELLALDAVEVRRLAMAPRVLVGTDPSGLLQEGEQPVAPAARRLLGEVAGPPRRAAPRPSTPAAAAEEVLVCPARRRLLEEGAPVGRRNNVAIRLASWLREGGRDAEEVEALLLAWNRQNPEPLDAAEVEHVVASAFAPPAPYRYGCRDPLIEPWCPRPPGPCPYHRAGTP